MVTTGLVISVGGRKRLAYFTDCQAVPEEAVEKARGAELLVLDALRHAEHSTHLTLRAAIEASERISPKQTLFIHMCHEIGHAETQESLPEGIGLAYDGLRITI
jgi:phosphoribosyl 1,2-cyclic phosphate phosphodiesterase